MPKNPPSFPPQPFKLIPPGGGGATTTKGARYYPPTVQQGAAPGSPQSGGTAPSPGAVTPGLGFNRQQFIQNYANMVAKTWTDDTYLQLLLSNPVDTLTQAGLPTIPGAVIRIVQHQITGMGKIEDEVDAWVTGNQTGLYDLFLPIKPDYVDFSPGGGGSALGGDAGCCCSPCCCCT